MTTSPHFFDYVLSDAASADLASFGQSRSAELDALLASLLADPTEANSAVRNLTSDGRDALYQYIALDYTVFYRFSAPFLIEIIAITPFPLWPD